MRNRAGGEVARVGKTDEEDTSLSSSRPVPVPAPVPVVAASLSQPISDNQGIVRAALILSVGNIVSRVLGLVRDLVKANLFGASGALSAFNIATYVPMSIFQLIIGGEMVNSSLVPVFSDYAASDVPEKRAELWRVVSAFLSLSLFVLVIFVLLIELLAPQVANLLGAGKFTDPTLFDVTVRLMRIATPAVLFLSLASLVSGVLYALKRFTLPAFTAAILNGTIVVVALIRGSVDGLVWGLLLGSLLQVLVQIPALRDARLRWLPAWRHPAIRRIMLLYAPIVAGLVVNQLAIGFSYRLAAGTGDQSIAYMGFATTLLQFPLGLVVTALSVATLPTLSQQASNSQWAAYRQTLAGGIRLVVTLILPATAGLFALAAPIVALLFQNGGEFTAADTTITALVLRVYLFGLPFAAVDQMLIFASYARQDTWRPALVGMVSISIYVAVALLLINPLNLLSLMVADAVKHVVHTVLMLWLLQRHMGGLHGHGISATLFKSLAAAVTTGAVAYGIADLLMPLFPAGGLTDRLAIVASASGAGLATYFLFILLLDIKDAKSLYTLIRRKVR